MGSLFSISSPNENLIGFLTTEIYYRTGITGYTADTQAHTQTESDTLLM